MKKTALVVLLLLIQLCYNHADGVDKLNKICKQRYRYYRTIICCGGRPTFRPKNPGCCGRKSFNTRSQMCCGKRVHPKSIKVQGENGTSIVKIKKCCGRNQPYELGKELCCNKNVVDNSVYGCCRNEKFEKSFALCCAGQITPIFSLNSDRKQGCCGSEAYDLNDQICCVDKMHNMIGGRNNTKCCDKLPFDNRLDTCCNGIRPKKKGMEDCCHGRMMNPNTHICCNYRQQERIYGDNTECCRFDNYRRGLQDYFEIYDTSKKLCCAGKLVDRRGKRSSCCIQQAYDVDKQICCGGKVFTKGGGSCTKHRCCAGKMFCADHNICCSGTYAKRFRTQLYKYRARDDRRTQLCCGWRKYDRKRYECLQGNKLKRLGQ